jgi:hypothetical protein
MLIFIPLFIYLHVCILLIPNLAKSTNIFFANVFDNMPCPLDIIIYI